MAEEKTATAAPAEAKRKFPLKTLLMLAVVLIVEAVAISAVFMLSGKPRSAHAEGAAQDALAIMDAPVEELVVAEKFQNTRSGKMFLYDTEVYIVVKRKYQDSVKTDIKDMSAAITSDIATIFRRADPAHLTEPTLATLTRQIKAALDARLPKDEEGKSVVQEVVIRKCTQLPLF
ncbi:MAG: hypothetical protein GC164_05405 [Phycisphaera sp.]|nr:hypothetical protein [Phycisphaera sp.]